MTMKLLSDTNSNELGQPHAKYIYILFQTVKCMNNKFVIKKKEYNLVIHDIKIPK